MTTAETFTVMSHQGDILGRGLTAAAAADIILSDDGRQWEIRPKDDGGFRLWSRQEVANRPWSPFAIWSLADNREEAEAEIFAEVLVKSRGWRGSPTAMTDAEYDRLQAEAEGAE